MGKNRYLGGKKKKKGSGRLPGWEKLVQDHWWVGLGLDPPVGCKSPEVVVGSLIFKKPAANDLVVWPKASLQTSR